MSRMFTRISHMPAIALACLLLLVAHGDPLSAAIEQPDLTVSYLTVPRWVEKGDDIAIEITIRNQGEDYGYSNGADCPAGLRWRLYHRLQPSGHRLPLTSGVITNAIPEDGEVTLTLTQSSSGHELDRFDFRFVIDPHNTIAERFEGNNSKQFEVELR